MNTHSSPKRAGQTNLMFDGGGFSSVAAAGTNVVLDQVAVPARPSGIRRHRPVAERRAGHDPRALTTGRISAINLAGVQVTEGVTVRTSSTSQHMVPNMGPIAIRGMWYPFVAVGVPTWAEERTRSLAGWPWRTRRRTLRCTRPARRVSSMSSGTHRPGPAGEQET